MIVKRQMCSPNFVKEREKRGKKKKKKTHGHVFWFSIFNRQYSHKCKSYI